MIGHRSGIACREIAHRQIAPLNRWIVSIPDPGNRGGVAPHFLPWRDGHRTPAAKRHRGERAFDRIAGIFLQRHRHRVERHRAGAEGIGKAKPHPVAPQIGFDDRAESLVGRRVLVGVRKGEALIGLNGGRGVSAGKAGRGKRGHRRDIDEIGGGRGRPTGDPMISLGAGKAAARQCQQRGQEYGAELVVHGVPHFWRLWHRTGERASLNLPSAAGTQPLVRSGSGAAARDRFPISAATREYRCVNIARQFRRPRFP